MQFHTIQAKHKTRKKKRIGRGGKRGTYSGRGMKGQKSRAGNRPRPGIRDLILRTPKLRGMAFTGSPNIARYAVNLSDIEKAFSEKTHITPRLLAKRRLVRPHAGKPFEVKILGGGKITKAHEFSGIKISVAAREKIISAGGKIHG